MSRVYARTNQACLTLTLRQGRCFRRGTGCQGPRLPTEWASSPCSPASPWERCITTPSRPAPSERGAGGYRVYGARDLERLEQIVVLRFLGIPLRQIGGMLSASPTSLANSLRAQRGTLANRRQLLD